MALVPRSNLVLERIVERGVELEKEQGALAAWVFMSKHGISEEVILRVLSTPASRRPSVNRMDAIEARKGSPFDRANLEVTLTQASKKPTTTGEASEVVPSGVSILHNDAAIAILTNAAQQLQALGIECLLSPMSLPQGMTISLHVGDSMEATLAAEVAAARGGEMAHSAAGAYEFAEDVAFKVSEATILKAAYAPPE